MTLTIAPLGRAFLLAGVVGAALLPAAAEAHNGAGAAFRGRAGPYQVYAYDGYAVPRGAVEYRLVLLDNDRGEPANDVRVHITATKPGAPETVAEWHSYANVVYYTLPNAYPHDWTVDLRLAGQAGRGHVSFRMHGLQPVDPLPVAARSESTGGSPIGLIIGGCLVGLTAAAAVLLLWRRQRS